MAEEMRTISDKNLELMETNAGLERVTSTTKTAIRKTNSERAELREVIRRLKLKQADPVQRNKELRQVETVELDGNTYYRLVPDRDV
jgi:hypothetical protein